MRPLGAILARNRLLKSAATGDQPSREVAFHAVRADERGPVRLLGYEDSRARFIGHATLGAPAALDGGTRLRAPEDEGLLYGFDPAASLGAEVRLPAGGSVDIVFVDGWAEDAARAAETIARYLGIPVLDRAALDAVLGRYRELLPAHERPREASPFAFSADGKELRMGWSTPRPWAHVLANPLGHGTVVSNDGASFSFAGNAQQNALTPFALDSVPVQQPGQLVYVVDLDTGEPDTPTFVPYRRLDARHEIVYGRGYATFVKERGDLELRLTHFVPPELPLELRLLEIRNHGYKRALYRVVSYAEIVLAETPAQSRGGLVTEHDRASGTLLFANPANDFRKGWAFATTSLDKPVLETVRARVLGGAEHDLTDPCLVTRGRADPAQRDDGRRVAAFSAVIEVGAGETARVAIVLGQAATREAAIVLARTWRDPAKVVQALADTQRWWNATLSGPEIATNQPAFDRLVNHWLPYQLLTARLWGRTGPSQRSGAYGFRDQLQDVLPLVWSNPLLARRQLLLHAAQQFLEGDVLQWWHTSWEGRTGLGSRSRIADIQLWLPYVAARYVEATGDRDLLAETVPFLEGKGGLPTEGEGYVFVPRVSRDAASLYEHCRRAIELALDRTGPNGLPLALTGDWNDGLDRVGFKGRGESVWLGFFLLDVLERFAPAAEAQGDGGSALRWQAEAVRLRQALDAMHRGDRYVRAVTDAGEELAPMDALMASWPVLAGAADLERGRATVTAALAQLEKDDTVLLLTPPFTEESRPYPGRITRYPPGVRENGGQYSHGVSWLVDALVRLADLAAAHGDAAEAARLRSRALEVWVKISPIHKTDPGRVERYGLPPHQQPADIYWGPGYEGRGGWSWYTGAAARMLSAAYAILGLRLEDGELVLRADAFAAKGPLQLQRVVYRGQVHEPGADRPGVRHHEREAESVLPVA